MPAKSQSAREATTRTPPERSGGELDRVLIELTDIERGGDEAVLTLTSDTADVGARRRTKGPPGVVSLRVSHLGKVFFPDVGLTKGDVMRYYVRESSHVLPLVRDRALSLKRFPNGIGGKSFFQQKAPLDAPESVRVQTLTSESGERQRRLIGGSLATLLYCVQLGAIEINPWNARVGSLEYPDYTVIDLDPGPRTPFERVVESALWIKTTLDDYDVPAAVKTSGSTGMHIFIPLPLETPEGVAERLSERVALSVARAHPKETTVERAVRARGGTKVYLDYGQNARGKTVAAAYSVRAKPGAPVSTPLHWNELTPALDPREFTIRTLPGRVATVGDIWAAAMRPPHPDVLAPFSR